MRLNAPDREHHREDRLDLALGSRLTIGRPARRGRARGDRRARRPPAARSGSPPSSTPSRATTRRSAMPRVRAEELGYDIAYNWDHFFPLYGDRDGPHLECWTVLGGLGRGDLDDRDRAARACITYRNPHLLADMARTVDRISGGRVDPRDRGRLEPARLRGVRLRVRHDGSAGSRRWARRSPRSSAASASSTRRPCAGLPLLIAGTGERRTLRLVAQHADGWHAAFPDRPEELEPTVAALRRWCDEVGRDPADIEWGVGVEPDDIERFLARDARDLRRDGLQPVHARLQRAGLARRRRRAVPRAGATSRTRRSRPRRRPPPEAGAGPRTREFRRSPNPPRRGRRPRPWPRPPPASTPRRPRSLP